MIDCIEIIPKRKRNRTWVLNEVTVFKERVPGRPFAQKTTSRLWPPTKQKNGRGLTFPTWSAAAKYFRDHKDRMAFAYGPRTNHMLKLIGDDK